MGKETQHKPVELAVDIARRGIFDVRPFFRWPEGRYLSRTDRYPCRLRAYTCKTISGAAIPTIPEGTPFVITWFNPRHEGIRGGSSFCTALPIDQIWNDEFVLVDCVG